MKRLVMAWVLAVIAAGPAYAALKSETIEYRQGGTALEGYLVYDDAVSAPRPGIVVVHEWMGLNAYARQRADQLAALGYVAFAADIYGKGVRPQTVEEASAESGKYKSDPALLRARAFAALDVLKARPEVDRTKLGAVGYCFGGTTVLEMARGGADVKGVVSFHGGLSTPLPQDAQYIKGRILALHGADDPFVPPAEVEAFKKEMAAGGVDYQLITYPGAVHGFTNPANTGAIKGALYNEDADKKSWAAMKGFFEDLFSARNE